MDKNKITISEDKKEKEIELFEIADTNVFPVFLNSKEHEISHYAAFLCRINKETNQQETAMIEFPIVSELLGKKIKLHPFSKAEYTQGNLGPVSKDVS